MSAFAAIGYATGENSCVYKYDSMNNSYNFMVNSMHNIFAMNVSFLNFKMILQNDEPYFLKVILGFCTLICNECCSFDFETGLLSKTQTDFKLVVFLP